MRFLVLGGTAFLGRDVVEAALRRGHEVTTFNRGQTNPDLFPGVDRRYGDRDGRLDALAAGEWDAVVDTSGYVPRVVRASAELLADRVERYVFVSSVSVYADFSRVGISEDDAVAELEDETSEDVRRDYGGLKARCEQVVEDVLPGRTLVVRPGLIVGPNDPTDRFTYWVLRVAEGGEVLAPGDPDRPVQVIDSRDLARWMVEVAERGATGIFNATGPDYRLTMGRTLDACREAAASDARFTWVDDEFLLAEGVGQWMELPLWLAGPEYAGMLSADVSKALAAGLTFRPIVETARDTLEWAASRDASGEGTRAMGDTEGVGLARDREQELLVAWDAR